MRWYNDVRYASDSRVQLSSPSMQSRQDPLVTVTKEEEVKSHFQNRYVKNARSLHEKQQQVGGPEYDFHYYLVILLLASSKHPRH